MMDVDATIKQLLTDNSEVLEGMTAIQKAAYLNTTTVQRVKQQETLIRFRTLYGHASFGPVAAEAIRAKLEAAISANTSGFSAILSTVNGWLSGTGNTDGIDIANAMTRGMLDQLVSVNILTADEVSKLKALGEDTLTLVEAAGLTAGQCAAHDIERVIANG